MVKQAVVTGGFKEFSLINADTEEIVITKEIGELRKSINADENIAVADFSEFNISGEYYIKYGNEKSYKFKIGDVDYKSIRDAVLEALNYQKCGTELNDKGIWSHEACHLSKAAVYGTDVFLDVSGGWHDAGDYGRYTVPAAKTLADIFLAHKLNYANDDYSLETAKYELDWLLKMQDSNSGGVYHKVTCKSFCGEIMPEEETDELVICPISATATADTAAIFAFAAAIYKDKDYCDILIKSAEKAWEWLENNPDYPSFKNPEGIYTGEYGDRNGSDDERYFAACSLYALTGDVKYHNYLKNSSVFRGLGWGSMGFYGTFLYLMSDKEKDFKLYTIMQESLDAEYNKIIENYNKEPYMVSNENYFWGSNLNVANNAMFLILYDALNKNTKNINIIHSHIHYLLGRNPVSKCYISGFGGNPLKNPHHRPSRVKMKTFAGLVSGGPCAGLNDYYASKNLQNLPPMKCYADIYESYSTNEIAIYWNSPVYFILAFLSK